MSPPEPGVWFHCAITYDGTSVSVYVNGTLVEPLNNGTRGKDVLLPDQPVIFVGRRDSKGAIKANFTIDDFFVFPFALEKTDLTSFQ